MLLPLVGVVGFLLHDLQYSFACIGAVLGIAIYGDSLLERANVVLAVDINASAALLCDEADGATLTADDGADHVTLYEQPQREVSGSRAAAGSTAAATAAAGASAPAATGVLFRRFNLHPTSLQFASI